MGTYYAAYIVVNLLAALGLTALFATSGGVLIRATVHCQTEAPFAIVRIATLIYGTLMVGWVFLNIEPITPAQKSTHLLFWLSEVTGHNLVFFAISAGLGIVSLLILAQPIMKLLSEMDQQNNARP